MDNEYYKKLDELYCSMREFLDEYSQSIILQKFFMNCFKSVFYGTLINNFFINLNQKNIKENNLPKGQIGKIKNKYKNIQRDVKSALSFSLKNKNLDGKYYNSFKIKIKKDFPEFEKMILEIENEIEFEKAKEYLEKKEEEIKSFGKPDTDLNTTLITNILEVHVQKKKCFSFDKNFNKLVNAAVKESLPKLSHVLFKSFNKNSKKMLDDQRKYQKGFENRLLFSPSLISPNSFSFSSYETKTSIYTLSINGTNGFPLNTAPIASITDNLFFFTVEMYPLMRQKERAP